METTDQNIPEAQIDVNAEAPAELPPPTPIMQPPAPQQDLEPLSPAEASYLAGLEATNRKLTMDLGDATIQLEAQKAALMNHRKGMTEAYANVLRMHGVREGYFNTAAGVIHVTGRHTERG